MSESGGGAYEAAPTSARMGHGMDELFQGLVEKVLAEEYVPEDLSLSLSLQSDLERVDKEVKEEGGFMSKLKFW